MTLKEFREATKDMPENSTIEFYHPRLTGSGYATVDNVDYIKDENIIELS